MKESTTYQAIKEEGRREEARRLLLRLGQDRFEADPTAEQLASIETITTTDRLEELALRTGDVGSWAALLQPPQAPPTSPRTRRRRST